MADLAVIDFTECTETVRRAFMEGGGPDVVADGRPVLLKPNLVNASPFPITTSPEFVEAVISVVREHTDAPLTIGEGCGDSFQSTEEIFQALGYTELAERYDVDLVDLNTAKLELRRIPDCPVFPEMWLPEVAYTHCIISLPVLKAHSLATMTGTLKNMMGFPPPKHYCSGGWKKSAFHARMHASIRDLNRYVTPDFTVMDASVGMAEFHLGGATCEPPLMTVLSGTDPVAIDRKGAELLGLDWRTIDHLQ